MKLSEMRQILGDREIQLTKSLGQNFLHDANQLRRIVETAEVQRSDRVLEVGPGLGPLTSLLLASAGEVLAIEKDLRLVQVLRERFGDLRLPSVVQASPSTPFELLHADAVHFLQREKRNWSDWKLVANLPYSVASPILVELAQSEHPPICLVATLQLEVARRLMAGAGSSDYGVLTLLVQVEYEPRGWFKIPADCFFPAPDVDSACVALWRRATPLVSPAHRQTFTKIVKRGFSQRRKMMMKLLRQDWEGPALEAAFAAEGLSPQVRAEAVTLQQFASLTTRLHREARE